MIRQVGRAVTVRMAAVATPRAAGRVLSVRIPAGNATAPDAVRDALLAAVREAHSTDREQL